ncbi:MAG: hypothetical protein Q9Q40_00935 [Acidobacteriota bacterium]|nr:hypothetical protein [Acidobacteriota bacterium]MDQ7087008.1 hypothetical protein [Acidobacteriota bacterium]
MAFSRPAPPTHLALCLTLLAAAAPGSLLAQQGEPTGAVAQIDLWTAAPAGMDLDYAFLTVPSGLSGGGALLSLAPERQATPRFSLAWRFGGRHRLQVGGAFWQYDAVASGETGPTDRAVGALLASPDFAIGRSQVDTARARLEMRASFFEAFLSWSPPGNEGLTLAAGVRGVRLQRQEVVTYGMEAFGTQLEEIINRRTDASAWGPVTRLAYQLPVGRHWSFEGGVTLAWVVGDVDIRAADSAFVAGSFDRATLVESRGRSVTGLQVDGRLQIVRRLTSRLDLRAGWSFSHWGQMARAYRFVDDVSQNSAVIETDSVAFEGLFLGVVFAP